MQYGLRQHLKASVLWCKSQEMTLYSDGWMKGLQRQALTSQKIDKQTEQIYPTSMALYKPVLPVSEIPCLCDSMKHHTGCCSEL